MLEFWDTVRGVELAETLIRELPKLTERKRQLLIKLDDADKDSELMDLVNSGKFTIAESYVNSQGITVVVLEKK